MIIYNKYGVVFLDTVVDDSSFLYNEICGSEYVRLDFSLTKYYEIPLGAYIIHRDVQYTLHEAPTIEMVSEEEYKITATFEAPAKQLELYSLRNYVDKRVDFMLTAKPAEHVGMVLEALRVRDKAWTLGNCIDAAEKTITYSYVSCMEALQMIADAFDTEWEIIDHTINLGKVEHLKDAPLSLSYGKDFGLIPGVGRANLGEARITAVYPQGTDRNINASTYGNPTLLLPKNQLIAYDGYRFDNELGYNKSNAVLYSTDTWGTCVFSGLGSGVEAEGVLDCTEIYPQREGTVTNVVVRNADSNLYDIQDNTIPNSLDYKAAIIPGNELTIVFQTGMLAGKEFGASYIHNGATDSTKRLFQIRPQEYDGVMMPGGNYMPQVGDKYAVFGVALPESYLADNDTKTGASWDMLRKCVKHLYEAEKPQYSFTGKLSSKWVRQQYSSVSPYLRIGAVISFGRVAFQPEAVLVRIESIKQYINTPYAVELSFGDRVIPTPYKITSKTVESRRSVEISRIASQTSIQLNAVKQNAAAPPVTDTVPFANDLTGVLEATAEEFTFRPSAGDKSIRDESAVIRKIKGNTIVARYADNTSEVLPMRTIGIETIGFNQWDEQWELGVLSTADGTPVGNNERGRSVNFFDVIPNATYYCATIAPTTTNSGGTVGSIGVWWYDSNRTMIKYDDITNKTRVAPSNARYAKICSYGGDVNAIFNGGVNINLSHSGVRDGKYEPYKKNIRLLPEIRKYFPNGMNGNANVWDEINTEKAIKRWGIVDLGTLTWSVQQASVNIFWSNSVTGLKKTPYSSYPNAISIFDTGRFYDLQVAKSNGVTTEIIGIHDAQARIMLYNPNYEATTEGASQLKASLQGVLLYYELAEPEYTDITEPMQLDYEVEDFGTEKALSLASSAPFRADIVYRFNAEGRIRDNSRNIERLENTITNGLMSKETIGLSPNGIYPIGCNKVYEMATAANITYNIGLQLVTDVGVDVTADNEWRIRIDARNGFSGSINFELSNGYLLRWAYPNGTSEPSTAPSIAQNHIYDIRFRMIGRVLLGTYEKY